MLKTLASPLSAVARVVRHTIAPRTPATPRRLFLFDDSCHGVVTKHTAYRTSNTYSTGNVGYVDRHTGLIALPGVRTAQIHQQEFWIDGGHRYSLTNRADIGIGEGHDLSILADRGRIAYILNHSTERWYRVTTLDDLLPTSATPWSIPAILGAACLVVPLVLCLLGDVTQSALTKMLHALTGLSAVNSIAVACTVVVVCFAIIGPAYSFFWLFGRRRRAQRHRLAMYEQGRCEMEAACRDELGIEPNLPQRKLGFWGLWLCLPALAFICLFLTFTAHDVYEEAIKPYTSLSTPPDYAAQLIGRWNTPQGIVEYASDHTYTVTKAMGGKVLERGTWNLNGVMLSHAIKILGTNVEREGKHLLQRVDASTLVYTDAQAPAKAEMWRRASNPR